MTVLLDTNVVVGFLAPGHMHHASAAAAVKYLQFDDQELCLVPQVCYEYWVVATRPTRERGLGMSHQDATKDLREIEELFTLLRDERTVFDHWQSIVDEFKVLGKQAHDARLIAAMRRHELTHLLTFNLADFQRYPGIELLDPNEFASL